MHELIKHEIMDQLATASGYVSANMPVTLSTDEVYEALVGEEHVLKLFHDASQYLPVADLSKHVDIKFDGMNIQAFIRLDTTKKWRHFLMPCYTPKINSESKLGQQLAVPVKVMTEWRDLRYLTQRIMNTYEDARLTSFFMPWLKTLDLAHVLGRVDGGKTEKRIAEREIRIIKERPVPPNFPSLTAPINDLCKAGNRLFGQYRMLQASMTSEKRLRNHQSPINVFIGSEAPRNHWVNIEFEEIRKDWQWRA